MGISVLKWIRGLNHEKQFPSDQVLESVSWNLFALSDFYTRWTHSTIKLDRWTTRYKPPDFNITQLSFQPNAYTPTYMPLVDTRHILCTIRLPQIRCDRVAMTRLQHGICVLWVDTPYLESCCHNKKYSKLHVCNKKVCIPYNEKNVFANLHQKVFPCRDLNPGLAGESRVS